MGCGVSGVPLGLGSLSFGGGSAPRSTCAWREAGSLITGINRVFPVGAQGGLVWGEGKMRC